MTTIQMTAIADLLPYIIPKAPTVPQPFAEFQARLAVIEFCERTRCWRQIVNTTVGTNNTTVIAPQFTTIHEIEEATINGRLLEPTQFTEAQPDELYGEQAPSQAKYIAQIAPGEVALYPFETGTLRVSCFLKPRHGQSIGADPQNPLADAYNTLPAFMVAQYAEKLAAGALARILATENADFFSPQMAAVYAGQFDEACNRHFSSNMRGQQRAPTRVKPRWI